MRSTGQELVWIVPEFRPAGKSVRAVQKGIAVPCISVTADAAWRRREETHPLIDWGRE